MALPANILTPNRFCDGKANFFVFKEEFCLALESLGILGIIEGTFLEPIDKPTISTVVETRDTAGNVTGTTTTTREVLVTPIGLAHPTKAAWKLWERSCCRYILTHVKDSKSLGCEMTKSTAANWKIVNDKLGKISAVEQVIARERLTGLRLIPVHEDVDEYVKHAAAFKAAHCQAVAAGNKFEESVMKSMFIESIDNDSYLEAAGAIPETASLEDTIIALNGTWWLHHRKHLREIERASAVTALMASAAAAAVIAAPANTGNRTRTRTHGNRGTGPCPNGNHGPPGNREAARHDLAHCWEAGGGDVANRPDSYRPRNYLSQAAANNVVTPNVQVQAAAVTVPDVFILSVQVTSLEGRLADPPIQQRRPYRPGDA
ncbi:hypothetical protein C8J56DRAFT_891876 [Mycena floridula]|nr:hypothetical protein C8J56DRAFT_891876 [Mycena floridula]